MRRCGSIAVVLLGAIGCIVDGDVGALTTAATDISTTQAMEDTTGDSSTTDTLKLDLGSPDVASMQCASVMQTTTIGEAPSDIVIVVARSMDEAPLGPVFENFAQLIANDGIEDVRVAMLAGYPPDGVCIDEPPLGVQQCPSTDDNPPIYRHFDEVIEADTLLQQLIDAYPQWSTALRPDARKHLFVLSSGDATMDPADFDAAFVALDPTLSGYVFHAIAPGTDDGDCLLVEAGQPWSVANEYSALAMSTGGVFENACDYDVGLLFEQLLDRIVEVALSCEYEIPPVPDDLVFDKGEVNVDYDDGFGVQTVGWVESVDDCVGVANGWYYDDPALPQQILMCPQTCARFQALSNASIEIRFGCTTIPAK